MVSRAECGNATEPPGRSPEFFESTLLWANRQLDGVSVWGRYSYPVALCSAGLAEVPSNSGIVKKNSAALVAAGGRN
jgi:hypothetical protein